MLDGWLMSLSDEDISMAIDAIYDTDVCAELLIARPDLMPIWCNPSTQRMAEHIASCDFDRVLAELSWNDHRADS